MLVSPMARNKTKTSARDVIANWRKRLAGTQDAAVTAIAVKQGEVTAVKRRAKEDLRAYIKTTIIAVVTGTGAGGQVQRLLGWYVSIPVGVLGLAMLAYAVKRNKKGMFGLGIFFLTIGAIGLANLVEGWNMPGAWDDDIKAKTDEWYKED